MGSGEEKQVLGYMFMKAEDSNGNVFEGVLIINILTECERQERKDIILPVNICK